MLLVSRLCLEVTIVQSAFGICWDLDHVYRNLLRIEKRLEKVFWMWSSTHRYHLWRAAVPTELLNCMLHHNDSPVEDVLPF